MIKKSNAEVPPEKLVEEILELYSGLIVPFMKVRRDMPFPTESERQETDGEHAFTVSLVAITVAERLDLKLDSGLIARYGLVHDLVEAYAGDVSVRTGGDAYHQKHQKEHESFLKIKEKYSRSAPWIIELIDKYEQQEDEESRFVYGIDKCMGGLVRMADGGKSWPDYYPEPDGSGIHKVIQRLRKKAETSKLALPFFDAMYKELDKRWPEWMKENRK